MATKKTEKPSVAAPKATAKKSPLKVAAAKKMPPPKAAVAKKKPAPKKKDLAVMGRPTDYTPELLEKAKAYLFKFDELGHSVPSVAGLSVYLEISRTTIYAWAKEASKADFSYILESILAKQEQISLAKGLNGEFNSTIVKLLLGKHGYSDRAETQSLITFSDLSDEELNAKIKSLIS
jgi:hypothetical protein